MIRRYNLKRFRDPRVDEVSWVVSYNGRTIGIVAKRNADPVWRVVVNYGGWVRSSGRYLRRVEAVRALIWSAFPRLHPRCNSVGPTGDRCVRLYGHGSLHWSDVEADSPGVTWSRDVGQRASRCNRADPNELLNTIPAREYPEPRHFDPSPET